MFKTCLNNKTLYYFVLFIFVCFIYVLKLNADNTNSIESGVVLSKFIITKGCYSWNEDYEIYSFNIEKDTIFICTTFSNLKETPYQYKCEIYDGENNLVFLMGSRIYSAVGETKYQSNYKADTAIDKPGKWLIKVYINNEVIGEKKVLAK